MIKGYERSYTQRIRFVWCGVFMEPGKATLLAEAIFCSDMASVKIREIT